MQMRCWQTWMLSNESWDTCVHLTSDCSGQGALCTSAPGHLWTAVSCLSFLLWHPLSLHLSTPPPLFLPPSLHPSHPPLTEDDVTFCQTARDHATVTVGCSVYTEIESNKSHERERERKKEGGTGKKKRRRKKIRTSHGGENVLSGVRAGCGLPKQVTDHLHFWQGCCWRTHVDTL